jgi:hypothetical protein
MVKQSIEDKGTYAVARLVGTPGFAEFMGLIEEVARISPGWPHQRLLVDLTEVNSLRGFTDQLAVGVAVSSKLRHLRIASLVPEQRITRTSEKAANRGGGTLRVFSNHREAVLWLLDPAGD